MRLFSFFSAFEASLFLLPLLAAALIFAVNSTLFAELRASGTPLDASLQLQVRALGGLVRVLFRFRARYIVGEGFALFRIKHGVEKRLGRKKQPNERKRSVGLAALSALSLEKLSVGGELGLEDDAAQTAFLSGAACALLEPALLIALGLSPLHLAHGKDTVQVRIKPAFGVSKLSFKLFGIAKTNAAKLLRGILAAIVPK